VHAHNTSANITPTLAGAVLLCLCSQVRGETGAPTQTFVIHGTPKTCSAITQLDSALLTDSQQFFAGWTESDYVDAVAWSQACADYGWQVPWRPRIPLLQAQHDRAALKSAQSQTASSTATAGVLPNTPAQGAISAPAQVLPSAAAVVSNPAAIQATVAPPAQAVPSAPFQAAVAAQAQIVPSAATGSELPSAPVQAAIAAPAQSVQSAPIQAAIAAPTQAVPIAATGSVLPSPSVQAAVAAPAQTVPIAATVALPRSHLRDHIAPDGEEDSLLTDNYYKEHFHQESLWVANKANLDIGEDRAPSSWSSNGIPAQMKNRLTADRIVLYCIRKTNSGESGKRPLLWDLRWCEAEEASAYNRLVSGNEFPTAGRAIVLGCAGVDSYIYLERCMATLTEAGMH
jgi:hypothetical protein